MNTRDYRNGHDTYFIVPGKEEVVYFEWNDYDAQAKRAGFVDWAAFHDHLSQLATSGGICDGTTDVAIRVSDQLIVLDPYTDSTKWPGLRSIHTPWVRHVLAGLLARKLIAQDQRVSCWNWAITNDIPEHAILGSVEYVLSQEPKPVILYHGTSSKRLARIKRAGKLAAQTGKQRVWRSIEDGKGAPPAGRATCVYFSTTRERASYFAGKSVRVDRRQGEKGSTPVILQVQLDTSELAYLRADDDWLEKPSAPKDSNAFLQGWQSLSEFGQVALDLQLPFNRLLPVASGSDE